MTEIFGTEQIVDWMDLAKLMTRFGLDLAVATFVVFFVYYRTYRNREMVFTYYVFNIITFALCALLRKVPMELGFALGLFAVFGILRYRTEPIRMRDLTYLFIVIGLGILNAVANKKVSLAELLAVNGVIAGATALLELHSWNRQLDSTPMLYDNLSLLKPDQHDALLRDLSERTGREVIKVQLHRIDMLRDAAELTIFYTHPEE